MVMLWLHVSNGYCISYGMVWAAIVYGLVLYDMIKGQYVFIVLQWYV